MVMFKTPSAKLIKAQNSSLAFYIGNNRFIIRTGEILDFYKKASKKASKKGEGLPSDISKLFSLVYDTGLIAPEDDRELLPIHDKTMITGNHLYNARIKQTQRQLLKFLRVESVEAVDHENGLAILKLNEKDFETVKSELVALELAPPEYQIPKNADLEIAIYDFLGRVSTHLKVYRYRILGKGNPRFKNNELRRGHFPVGWRHLKGGGVFISAGWGRARDFYTIYLNKELSFSIRSYGSPLIIDNKVVGSLTNPVMSTIVYENGSGFSRYVRAFYFNHFNQLQSLTEQKRDKAIMTMDEWKEDAKAYWKAYAEAHPRLSQRLKRKCQSLFSSRSSQATK